MNLITAMTSERVIGLDGGLPWKIQEDMNLFKEKTLGNVVLMGRNTFDSIGKALPKRQNVVVSKHPIHYRAENLYVCRTLDEAIKKANSFGPEVYVIGGASIYEQTLPLVSDLHISQIRRPYEGDTFFPKLDMNDWELFTTRNCDEFEYEHYQRKLK